VLDSAVPEIRSRTSALRSELDERRRLEQQSQRALDNLQASEAQLQLKRAELAELETRQRLTSREARSNAVRESERALALAEEARDLDGLMDRIDAAAQLRRELAALPGPVLRPANIDANIGAGPNEPEPGPLPSPASTRAPAFQLPVQGRTIRGFGELRDSGLRSNGLVLAPARGAQVVAPGSGRVAFSGPYQGFDRIVIIEHDNGWTSLVTGLGRITAAVGDEVIAGAPLGVAAGNEPTVTMELRRAGELVNPLNYID